MLNTNYANYNEFVTPFDLLQVHKSYFGARIDIDRYSILSIFVRYYSISRWREVGAAFFLPSFAIFKLFAVSYSKNWWRGGGGGGGRGREVNRR